MTDHDRRSRAMTSRLLEAANRINEALALAGSGPAHDELKRLYLEVVNAPMRLGLAAIEEDEQGWVIAPACPHNYLGGYCDLCGAVRP